MSTISALDHQAYTIMVVDDTPANLGVVVEHLEDYGFRVVVAQDGEEGLKRARFVQPNLILLDVMMPGIDGFETCRRLKADEKTRDIPIIFMTSLTQTEDRVTGFAIGGVDYVTKPLQVEEVLARVKTHLDMHTIQKQLAAQNVQLHQYKERLEEQVAERTAELLQANAQLQQDITERKQTEAALRESEERYRALYEDNPSMYFTLTPDGAVLSVNRFGANQLGYTPEELVGHSVLKVFHRDDRAAALRCVEQCLADAGRVRQWELRKVRKDGAELWVKETARVVQQADGSMVVLIVCEDITERKQLEEQLRLAQKLEAIGRLAGGVAHDFNNVLTAINGYTTLALRRLGDDHPVRHYIEEAKKATDRAANLIRQLLAFGRKQILQPLALNLNDIVGDMNRMLRRLIGEDIQLVSTFDPELKLVKADPGQIEQVLVNLVVNARDAMPRGGTLTIETKNVELDEAYASKRVGCQPGKYVMLAVSDSGIGMDEETQQRIFEPFFTTKEKGKGTGLGLSTVYGIVKQSGGNIWVSSDPGQGTSFRVYLPQAAQEESRKKEAVVGRILQPGGSETVLLVEDEDIVRQPMREILEQGGYRVLEASSGDEAIQLCEGYQESIHLLMTDVVMPKMSGKELADRLRPLRPEMKVLFMSGYTDEAIVSHGVLDAGVEFIQKPFSPDAIAHKLREVLDAGKASG